MAWASVIGAIDYSTDDNSLGFRIRENIILDVVSAMRQYDWSQMSAVRNAVLSRGTSWLVPSSSARVSQEFIDSLRKSKPAPSRPRILIRPRMTPVFRPRLRIVETTCGKCLDNSLR